MIWPRSDSPATSFAAARRMSGDYIGRRRVPMIACCCWFCALIISTDGALMCQRTVIASNCTGTSSDVNGEDYCETGKYFDSANRTLCEQKACCSWERDRCVSRVGKRNCYHLEGGDCHHFEEAGEPECPCLAENIGNNGPRAWTPNTLTKYGTDLDNSYGNLCRQHDRTTAQFCTGSSPPDWCSKRFCWVDPANCSLASYSSVFFPHEHLHFSYATCGEHNTFNSHTATAKLAREVQVRECQYVMPGLATGTKSLV
jgi:hypothetical protein